MRGNRLDGLRSALASGASVVARMSVHPETQYPSTLLHQLTPDDQNRAARFRFDKDRTIFIASRILLRCIVNTALGGVTWRFAAANPNDKPKLDIADGRQLFANLSHTSGCVLVALHATAEVGVDVESDRDMGAVASLARLTMTNRERNAIASASPPEPFFRRLWVRKEAVLKAFGVGLSANLKEIDVLEPSNVRLPSTMAAPLTLIDLDGPPHPAAVCILARNVPAYPISLEFDGSGKLVPSLGKRA
jgi:4'-phosphopantetheinyl transferase